MKETWYNIKEFEGYYQLSDLGRLRRVRPTIDCGLEVVRYLKTEGLDHGNRVVQLSGNGIIKEYVIQTLFFDTFYPEHSGKKFILIDGNKSNLKKSNFKLIEGKLRRGKYAKGVPDIPIEKLVFHFWKHQNFSLKDIADKLGITHSCVGIHLNKNEEYRNRKSKCSTIK